MRKLITVLILSLAASSYGQNRGVEVPEVAKLRFAEEFPSATHQRWQKAYRGDEGDQERYEVVFTREGNKFLVSYSNDGYIRALEESLPINKLPKAVKNYLKKSFKDYNINEASIVSYEYKKETYQVEISNDETYSVLVFDKKGEFLNESQVNK
ncbi:PepSY-like domain-containing protein [Flavobacterium sp.]|uniref:PepSY-like domain-containing protein n=1 Tax=Flavobacterium sp. TaxID=239 RepID=UPI003527FA22